MSRRPDRPRPGARPARPLDGEAVPAPGREARGRPAHRPREPRPRGPLPLRRPRRDPDRPPRAARALPRRPVRGPRERRAPGGRDHGRRGPAHVRRDARRGGASRAPRGPRCASTRGSWTGRARASCAACRPRTTPIEALSPAAGSRRGGGGSPRAAGRPRREARPPAGQHRGGRRVRALPRGARPPAALRARGEPGERPLAPAEGARAGPGLRPRLRRARGGVLAALRARRSGRSSWPWRRTTAGRRSASTTSWLRCT